MVCPALTTNQTGGRGGQKVGQRSAPSLLLVGVEVVAMVSRPEQDGVNPSRSVEGVTW